MLQGLRLTAAVFKGAVYVVAAPALLPVLGAGAAARFVLRTAYPPPRHYCRPCCRHY